MSQHALVDYTLHVSHIRIKSIPIHQQTHSTITITTYHDTFHDPGAKPSSSGTPAAKNSESGKKISSLKTAEGSAKKSEAPKKGDAGKKATEPTIKKPVEIKAVPLEACKEELMKIMYRLDRHDKAWPFLEPVDPAEVCEFVVVYI
jgi:hypothetical protein